MALNVTRVSRRGESWEIEAWRKERKLKWWVTPTPDGGWTVTTPGGATRVIPPQGGPAGMGGQHGPVKSPMAGVLTSLAVSPGDQVEAGQELAVIEAMKTRFAITAKAPGIVAELTARPGERVAAGQALLNLLPPSC
jgi:biotin carboxyl carrier protein